MGGRLLGACVLVLAGLVPARAVIGSCSALPNPVYLRIASSQEVLIKRLARSLRENTPNPMTLVYVMSSSNCGSISPFLAGTGFSTNASYVPSSSEDPTWTPASPAPSCTTSGELADLAGTATFLDACGVGLTAGFGAFPGPVQAYDFVVPQGAGPTAITAEQAYFVFGFGTPSNTIPWIDETQLFIRTTTASTMQVLGANIHVPAAQWRGVPLSQSANVVTSVANASAPAAALGVLDDATAGSNEDTLDRLAFQAFGQKGAYYTGSTAGAHDSRNVRDGHYALWSRMTFVAAVDVGGVPTNPNVAYLLAMLSGGMPSPAPNFSPESAVISTGLVPDCAMGVTRTTEGGDLSRRMQATPCACLFDSAVGTAGPSCTTCGVCSTGVCRRGYCEAN